MAGTTIVFFGIRISLVEEDIEAMENRTHHYLIRSRKEKLDYYWGKFERATESYYLFVGHLLGKFGEEDRFERQFVLESIAEMAIDLKRRLPEAGFEGIPTLFIQFESDA